MTEMSDPVGHLAGRLHGDLRRIARRHLGRERRNDLEPCSLINEVYLRMARQRVLTGANDAQFLALASVCMGRVLVDAARRRRALKRPQELVQLTTVEMSGSSPIERTLPVREGLLRLAELNRRQASIIRMRFFEDLSLSEIVLATGLSIATVKRDLHAGLETLRSMLRA